MIFLPVLIACALGILAFTFVLTPVFRYTPSQTAANLATSTENALANEKGLSSEREQSAKSALQEIELDFQLGNITEEDYTILRERYVRRALIALKTRHENEQSLQDATAESTDMRDEELDKLIETRLQALRALKEQEDDVNGAIDAEE